MKKTYRDIMGADDLDWCRCYATRDGSAYYVMNEGRIISAQVDGQDISVKDENQLWDFARKVNPEAENYSEAWDAINEANMERCGCGSCPWNDICEAMDEVIEDDEDEEETDDNGFDRDDMENMVDDFLADRGNDDDDDPIILDGEPELDDGEWSQAAHDSEHNYTLVPDADGNIRIIPN